MRKMLSSTPKGPTKSLKQLCTRSGPKLHENRQKLIRKVRLGSGNHCTNTRAGERQLVMSDFSSSRLTQTAFDCG